MTLSRIELDGIGSPSALAARIHDLDPGLPLDFSIEALCHRLDIHEIADQPVSSFAAMLLMHPDKAWGSIIVAEGTSLRRRRFSIGHELGHFLMPSHRPCRGAAFNCSQTDLRLDNTREADRGRKMEAEANRFAAQLLMPPKRIRASLRSRQPDLAEIVRLAGEFDVSKAAMARSYVDAHRETLALIIAHEGRIKQAHRPDDFPWIDHRIGEVLPQDSITASHTLLPGQITPMEECDPETWLGSGGARKVEVLSEQLLVQKDGWAMILLHAEPVDRD
ncbi:ImmA/IrrE family metallo-endopeptidase [Alteraurantiacibacter buctensis]|uniref:ImmA/IrrE family metallo-endopeptidase n=1 Tax=Alteraurantiacibacter buctensis TaxID=1503981 RepID=A0A844Z0H8_9SPHN|nr:ImmA/IrrE family metallo-endopeptidase [Alteraurantiacibacter buctensis]MXO72848.1 ImmA/IrrE family metallo-endopeptidase [Alteraurantiacibacter buctensis]